MRAKQAQTRQRRKPVIKRGRTNELISRNIDWFCGRYRVRVHTPQGEVRELFDELPAAEAFLAEVRAKHPDTLALGFRSRPLPHKQNKLPVGISRVERADYRRANAPAYVVFQVAWRDAKGVRRIKSFQAGNAEIVSRAEVAHAEKSAIAFRQAWEYALTYGMRFVPEAFDRWREVTMYPFRPPAPVADTSTKAAASSDDLTAAVLKAAAQWKDGGR